jgi:hypothetical protein
MLRITSGLLAVILFVGVGYMGPSASAEELPKTGEKRDTLLYVRTTPPGAEVLLNGRELGTSDGLFRVEPGSSTVSIELEGRELGERKLVIQANVITRIELTLEPQAEANDARFIGQLPQGTVELVGVTDWPPMEQSRWWKPDGSPAELGPFLSEPTNWSSPAQKTRTFLLRFQNLPSGASRPSYRIEPSTGTWWGSTSVLDDQGRTVADYMMFSAEVGDSAKTARLRVNIDAGDWATVVEFKNIALRSGQETDAMVVLPEARSSSAPVESAQVIGHVPPGPAEPVPYTVGVRYFRDGDSISITDVKATSSDLRSGNKVLVKGYYTLASSPQASLCLYATATEGSGTSEVNPKQRINITKGKGEFELSETLPYDGYLHLTFYSIPAGKPFGGMYFGTAKQMKEIEHWDVRSRYTSE